MADFDVGKFRTRFPAFKDTTKYPDATITIFYDMAKVFVDTTNSPCRILNGDQLALAVEYLTAHLLYIATQSAGETDPDNPEAVGIGAGGDGGGFVVSATIGDISVTKLAPPTGDSWEWWLNGSEYGSALLALLKLLAVGGMSMGGLPEREGFRKIGGVFW